MVKNAKIDYDYENDILYLYTGEKVKDSLQIENFVLDFSHENKIVGIEVIDASKILSKISQIDMDKKVLSNIENAEISIIQGRELVYVMLYLHFSLNQERMDIRIPVPAPVAVSLPV